MSLPPTQPNKGGYPADAEPAAAKPTAAPGAFDPDAAISLAGAEPDNKTPADEPDDDDANLTEDELRALCSPLPSLETFLRGGLLFLLAIALASVLFPVR